MSDDYDLVVIGSGPAGEKGAAHAAYFGKRVALVERNAELGGTPVSSAGIPTKTLREAALYVTGFGRRHLYGVALADRPRRRATGSSSSHPDRDGNDAGQRPSQPGAPRHRRDPGHRAVGTGRQVAVALANGRTRTAEGARHPC